MAFFSLRGVQTPPPPKTNLGERPFFMEGRGRLYTGITGGLKKKSCASHCPFMYIVNDIIDDQQLSLRLPVLKSC